MRDAHGPRFCWGEPEAVGFCLSKHGLVGPFWEQSYSSQPCRRRDGGGGGGGEGTAPHHPWWGPSPFGLGSKTWSERPRARQGLPAPPPPGGLRAALTPENL